MRWWVQWLSCSLAAGATLFLVGAAFHLVVAVVAPSIPVLFEEHSEIYRPWKGWTSKYMVMHPIVYGFVFAAVYLGLRKRAAFPPGVRAGLVFGACVFVVGSLPVYLLAFASFQLAPEVLVSWVVQSLFQYTLAGMTLGCVCDGASLRLSTVLPAPASRTWELLMLKDSFLYITRGLMSYTDTDRWPTRLLTEGTTFRTRVRLFGIGPSFAHNVQVVRVDEGRGEIETEESGGLVRAWNHRMHVEPVSEVVCRYTDRIRVQAGLLTPLVWLFAVGFYCYRQRRWQRWVRVAEVSTAGNAASDTGCDVVSGTSSQIGEASAVWRRRSHG